MIYCPFHITKIPSFCNMNNDMNPFQFFSQCGNSMIFLFVRFYVKSILCKLNCQKFHYNNSFLLLPIDLTKNLRDRKILKFTHCGFSKCFVSSLGAVVTLFSEKFVLFDTGVFDWPRLFEVWRKISHIFLNSEKI